ncbi:hypothetical protein B7486_13475 [cyanobacterium TDX16]|nr:hypothetical protein B7486_13475 [cyanobacterium TDX16]
MTQVIAAESRPAVELQRLSDVQPEAVSWLWPGRIPAGKISLIIGDPCVGKSFLLYDIASRVSTGRAWPDLLDGQYEPADIVLLTAEDDLADTVRPRIDAAEGDPTRIVAITSVADGPTAQPRLLRLDRDIAKLEEVIKAHKARLLAIDPLSAYLGTADSYRDTEVRRVLAPLAEIAARHRVAVVAVMHLGKDASRSAMYRANGSIAFTAAPRAVWAVGRSPEDEGRRVMACVKMNLAQAAPSLSYRIQDGGLYWDAEPVALTADELLGQSPGPDSRSDRVDARRFLEEILTDGPVPARRVVSEGRNHGFSPKQLRSAQSSLGVRHRKVGQPGSPGLWEWSLAEKDSAGAEDAQHAPL